ncbi:toxin-activating lysine-acyltransferase [Kalamiella sp. sgz302252]|uniref:toxin-activating lysine-acyltransferase n=1 Tax=Pantoea sp. sgz302252 TaxID=3341827 RepID=UPI0036D359BC
MKLGEYDICAPMILGGTLSEAEVFGASVWLWLHSAQHRDIPLHCLPDVLLPIIKRQQYALVSRAAKPLFFLSWMWLDEAAEQRYISEPAIMVQERDWACGDRLWFRDWIAPFGENLAMARLVSKVLFPDRCVRSLYHRGAQLGLRVINFKGQQVSSAQARAWRAAHPLLSVNVQEGHRYEQEPLSRHL